VRRSAGEGGERSEAGEGLAAAEIFFQHDARAARWFLSRSGVQHLKTYARTA
jgi:hypothetical protein